MLNVEMEEVNIMFYGMELVVRMGFRCLLVESDCRGFVVKLKMNEIFYLSIGFII